MNVLIITAHPATYGFTHKIAAHYKNVITKHGGEARIFDLYNEKYQQPFLCFENIKEDCGATDVKDMFHEQISWSDEIVFVSPVWQMGVPAILKNFFDVNMTAGFAFKYTADGLVKLLTDKHVRFFLTADGPWWLYMFYKPVLRYLTLGGFLHGYAGTKIASITIFSDMYKKRNDEVREKMLHRVEKIAMKSVG